MAAATVAGMSCMACAVVDDFQQLRLKESQLLAYFKFQIGSVQAGKVLRKGLTVMPENTPPVT